MTALFGRLSLANRVAAFAASATVLAACQRPPRDAPEPRVAAASESPVPPEPPQSEPRWTAAITADSLRRAVEFLASDAMAGRPTPSPELDRAADSIAATFAELGLSPPPGAADFRQRFVCARAGEAESANVVALLPGSDPDHRDDVVVVSAHYDHLGARSGEGDRVFNGANDNASGVAAMLAIAQALAGLRPRPARTVMFVAFCGEELGLRGSRYFSEHPLLPLANTIAQFNLEMLGRAEPGEPLAAWVTGAELSDFLATLQAVDNRDGVVFVPASAIGPVEGGAFSRSDNYPLALERVVAHSISTGHLDATYHSVDDEPAGLDYDRMARVVRAIAECVRTMAGTVVAPTYSPAARESLQADTRARASSP